MPRVGETAPDFELTNQDGKPIRLSDFRGRKVILFAFPKANSLGCNTQACSFRDAFPRVQTQNAVVLGMSADSQEELRRWKEDKRLPYDLLSDPDHKVLEAWGAWGLSLFGVLTMPRAVRSYWVIDENGMVIDAQVGVSPARSVQQAVKMVGG